ncbi:MAG: DUF1553 domain-containing protein [Thermoanaerobaculia bacterium]|jgi:hypothetical protein
MTSLHLVLPHRAGVALAAAFALVSLSAPAGEPATGDVPARTDCTFDSGRLERPEQRWRQLSRDAELVAGEAAASRRHPVRPPAVLPPIPRRSVVDDEIFGAMATAGVAPTRLTTDEEFIRRVTLDLTGDIPTSTRVAAFLADTRADKRDHLVDELLASDGFVDRWTLWFGDLVQNVAAANNTRLYAGGRNAYYLWIRDSIRAGKPYDAMVRELVSGNGDSYLSGPPNYAVRQIQRNGPPQDTFDNLAARSVEKFLAVPFECLSCHNGLGHLELVNSWLAKKQRRDFWETAAFFSRVTIRPVRLTENPTTFKFLVSENLNGSYQLNTSDGNKTPRQPATGESATVTPSFILGDGAVGSGETYRVAFARHLTEDRQFARATVNQLWKELFHLGIVEPVDGFDLARLDPATLPAGAELQPTHPKLLEALASEFEDGGYDLRAILRLMVTSSAYQLATDYTPGSWSEAWTATFARHYPRRIMAESLVDAIATATQIAPSFTVDGIGTFPDAMALPDPLTPNQRNQVARFMSSFGRGDRDQNRRTYDGSILQALGMMNDRFVTDKVKNATKGSTVQSALANNGDDGKVVDAIYVATLSRYPTAAERAAAVAAMKGSSRVAATEDLQFVLLNSLEFLFN